MDRLIKSQLIQQARQSRWQIDEVQIPSQNQIIAMFEKNGFRPNNVVTRNQLQQLFDRQYTINSLNQTEDSEFSKDLFNQLWDHLELLSDGSAKIQNICKVIYDALLQLKRKLQLIEGNDGIKKKRRHLKDLEEKERQLTNELDLVDAQYEYHQENIKSERNMARINIGKLKAQIDQLQRDKHSFQAQLKMLIITIGQHDEAPVQTKVIEGIMSLVGMDKKQYSSSLKFVFILSIISIAIELFVLSYRFSFLNITGLFFLLYVLFCGYYTDRSIVYIIVQFVFSILIDLGYVYLNMFTTLILNPIVFTENKFLKYIAMISILVSVVIRMVLILKILPYKQIPKTILYFDFWGQQITLNRRNKQFLNSSQSFGH